MTERDAKCEGCAHWSGSYGVAPCGECSRVFSGMTKDYYLKITPGRIIPIPKESDIADMNLFKPAPPDEEDYLTKLIDDHWAYVEQVLVTHGNAQDVDIVKFHYTTAFRHGWKHAMEYMEGKG